MGVMEWIERDALGFKYSMSYQNEALAAGPGW